MEKGLPGGRPFLLIRVNGGVLNHASSVDKQVKSRFLNVKTC